MRRNDERGQALPLVLVILAVAMGATLLSGELGRRALAESRAQTAADAAALAGAAEGPEVAADLARVNGSRGTDVEGAGGDATVTVRLGEGRAVARAQAPMPATVGTEGLTPEMTAAIARAEGLLGVAVPISSGWRSAAAQAALWADRQLNPYPVAPPGTSMHERGMAIDVPRTFVATLRPVAVASGLCQPLPLTDPVHFELCRRTTDARVAT